MASKSFRKPFQGWWCIPGFLGETKVLKHSKRFLQSSWLKVDVFHMAKARQWLMPDCLSLAAKIWRFNLSLKKCTDTACNKIKSACSVTTKKLRWPVNNPQGFNVHCNLASCRTILSVLKSNWTLSNHWQAGKYTYSVSYPSSIRRLIPVQHNWSQELVSLS